MGLFHKTLEQAKRKFEEGKHREGMQIINEHLEEIQHILNPLNMLIMKSHVYRDNLNNIMTYGQFTGEGYQAHKAEVLRFIEEAEKALWSMRSYVDRLAKEELRLK